MDELQELKAKLAVLEQQGQAQVAALAHRHITVTYAVIAVLVVVLGLAGVGGYLGVRLYDVQLARAEKLEEQYNADRKAFADQLAESEAQRTQDSAHQADLMAQITARNKAASTAVTEALKPDATLPTIAAGLQLSFKGVPGFDAPLPLNGVYIEATGQQIQQITAYKIDHDKLFGDLADTKNSLKLEQDKTTSLSKDLQGCESENTEANKVIAGYKKAAKLSKFKKFLGGAEKVALFVGGVYLGHKL